MVRTCLHGDNRLTKKMWSGTLLVLLTLTNTAFVSADVLIYDNNSDLVEQFTDLPARFGPSFPLEGLRVRAIVASPDIHG